MIKIKVLVGVIGCNNLLPDARQVGPVAHFNKLINGESIMRAIQTINKEHYVIDVEDIQQVKLDKARFIVTGIVI